MAKTGGAISVKPTKPARAWQRMLSGRRLDLLDPSPLDIEISDIAHGLARVARWNGQTYGDHAYSVAQHSLLVEQIFSLNNPAASVQQQLAALLHDGAEYVIGDMISPFKAVLGSDYKQVESRLETAIFLRFGLPATLAARVKTAIKKADMMAAFFEASLLAGFSEREAADLFGRPRGFSAAQFDLSPLPAATVQQQFIARFAVLEAQLHD